MGRFSRLATMTTPVILAIALLVHFGMTLAYLTPVNPLKLRFTPLINGYMTPFFQQNWHLFAPDPLNDTRIIMVSCRVRQPDAGAVESGWKDITTPYWAAHIEDRLGPATRVARAVTGGARLTYSPDPTTLQMSKKMEEHKKKSPDDDSSAQLADAIEESLDKERDESFRLGADVLNRAGSAHCDALHGKGRTEAVRMRMAVLKFPRFSQRDLPDSRGEMTYYDFDWAPYQSVAPISTWAERREEPTPVARAAAPEGK